MGPVSSDAEPRQGDYLPEVTSIFMLGVDGQPYRQATPDGVLVITQCCDLAQGNGFAQVSQVVSLEERIANEVRRGKTSRYVPLTELRDRRMFGDLSVIGGVKHEIFKTAKRTPGVSLIERHNVGDRVARRYSRFAYPDEVVPLLSIVVDKITQKAGREHSNVGKALARIERIRVEVEQNWSDPPWDITLLLILREGEMPTLEEPVGHLVNLNASHSTRLRARSLTSIQDHQTWLPFGGHSGRVSHKMPRRSNRSKR